MLNCKKIRVTLTLLFSCRRSTGEACKGGERTTSLNIKTIMKNWKTYFDFEVSFVCWISYTLVVRVRPATNPSRWWWFRSERGANY